NHDQAILRIDIDGLPVQTTQAEHATLAGQDPGLVAVSPVARRRVRLEMPAVSGYGRGGQHPGLRDDLPVADPPVVRQEQAKAGVVAQYCMEAAERRLLPGAIDQPRGVRL